MLTLSPVYDTKEEKYLNRHLRVAQEKLAFETSELKNVIEVTEGLFRNYNLVQKDNEYFFQSAYPIF